MTYGLKPCPFCGGDAEMRRLDLSAIDEGWQVYGVWCVNDIHAEEHGGYQHGHYIDNFATEAEAIEAWNTRAELTCRNVHEPPKDTTFWPAPHFKCSKCGATHVSMEYVFFCPNCGARVVEG